MSSNLLHKDDGSLGKLTDDWSGDDSDEKEKEPFDLANFLSTNRVPVALLLVGLILSALGVFMFRGNYFGNSDEIEVLETTSQGESVTFEVVVEIAGAVDKPGVYKLAKNARVEDLLVSCGGLSDSADGEWVEKYINRAALLTDGQKLYIPSSDGSNNLAGQQSDTTSANFSDNSGDVLGDYENLININTASQNELESLWGIGPVTAQNIIEQRPYSTVKELLEKKILKSNVYERNEDKLTVY